MTSRQILVGDVPPGFARHLCWRVGLGILLPDGIWPAPVDTLWAAGQSEGLVAAGYKAIDSLRLEKGYRYWSSEISPDYTPLEAGLGFAVKLNKKDFIGKEALLKQKEAGIKRKLCCLTLSDNRTIALARSRSTPRMAKISAGWLPAAMVIPLRRASFMLLPIEFAKAGTELEVEFLGEQVGAVVAQSPLWDPKGERIRA